MDSSSRRVEFPRSPSSRRAASFLLALLVGIPAAIAQGPGDTLEPDRPTLHVVSTSHLDTQWRWTIRDTIERFVPATMRENFAHFERYPGYVFSFEGAFRYSLMKEYYPQEWERVKEHVRAGRWRVAGSWWDAVDTHVPSPESLIRQALYGNGFFRRELGTTSRDVFLPDCFGFGYALPAAAAHAGLVGFTTQKLTWGSAYGMPFPVGLWEGVDGSRLVASLNPGNYVARIESDLSSDPAVLEAVEKQRALSGIPVAMRFFGVGDQGGGPDAPSVARLVEAMSAKGPVEVRSAGADDLARDLAARLREPDPPRLPLYRGELPMTAHGAGCYTSQAAMKRWNRKNERLADAAERAAVAAGWLGAAAYARETLAGAWKRFLWHQFHDDLTGTSIPEAYAFSWDDELISLSELAGVLGDAVGGVASGLDTRARGIPVVVYNALSAPREDVVEADLAFEGGPPPAVRVLGPDGKEAPAQIVATSGSSARVVFLARVPPLGCSVFDVRPAAAPAPGGALRADAAGLENERYRVRLDGQGDVASIFDKRSAREILSAPLALQLIADDPGKWPAWEIDYDDLSAKPRAVVAGPARVRVAESGPARVALEVEREAGGSTFVQTIRLAAGGAGDRVEIDGEIGWRTPGALLKAAFPLSVESEKATYDLGLGTIERGVNRKELYEVPAQQWADVTATDGSYGVAVLNDGRYGWDRPGAGTLRLSLVRTPAVSDAWSWVGDQKSQDLGRHRVLYALVGHEGDHRAGGVAWQADRVNQPLAAWQAKPHAGPLGRSFSLASVLTRGGASPSVSIGALKLAEEGDEIVVRLYERSGTRTEDARLAFARPIASAREINGAEEDLDASARAEAPAFRVEDGALVASFLPYRPRTFAIRLAAPPARIGPPTSRPLDLPFDLDGASLDGAPADGDFDGKGLTLAGELLAGEILAAGVPFRFGSPEPGRKNVLTATGQEISLPPGRWNRLYLVAASVGGDADLEVAAGGKTERLPLQAWDEPVGQWDDRLGSGKLVHDPDEIAPAYLKPARVAWAGTHRHHRETGNDAYALTRFFLHRVDLPEGARSVRLSVAPRARILAATVARSALDDVRAAQPFLDPPLATRVRVSAPSEVFVDTLAVILSSPTRGAEIRYTLDGSPPSRESPLYEGPISLAASAIVKARAFAPGLDDAFVAAASFRKETPKAPSRRTPASPGLSCRYYEGTWSDLPRFQSLEPARVETIATVGLPPFAREENLALELRGYLRVPERGVYTFWLTSDDGSALWLDGERLIDADRLGGTTSERAEIALEAGLHALYLPYFQRRGERALLLEMAAPGGARKQVSSADLFHGE